VEAAWGTEEMERRIDRNFMALMVAEPALEGVSLASAQGPEPEDGHVPPEGGGARQRGRAVELSGGSPAGAVTPSGPWSDSDLAQLLHEELQVVSGGSGPSLRVCTRLYTSVQNPCSQLLLPTVQLHGAATCPEFPQSAAVTAAGTCILCLDEMEAGEVGAERTCAM
jgi:hypothetical protein